MLAAAASDAVAGGGDSVPAAAPGPAAARGEGGELDLEAEIEAVLGGDEDGLMTALDGPGAATEIDDLDDEFDKLLGND